MQEILIYCLVLIPVGIIVYYANKIPSRKNKNQKIYPYLQSRYFYFNTRPWAAKQSDRQIFLREAGRDAL